MSQTLNHRLSKHASAKTPGQGALTHIAFVLACALVIARATFLETVRETEPVEPGATAAPLGASATTSLVYDLLLCVPALLVLLQRAIGPSGRLRLSAAHLLFFAIAVCALCSAFWASDKFLTVVTATHLLAASILVWTMSQLVNSWLRVRLIAAMCFGLLLIYVANGTIYRLVDVPDNIEYWKNHKDEELRKRGWEPGSFQALQFEQKIVNGEMVGFNASPNTFAAIVVMLAVVCAGVVIQRLLDNDEVGWPLVTIIGILAAGWIVHYTRSKAAMLTPIAAGVILAALGLLGGTMARWRKALYFTGASLFLVAAAGIAAAGVMRGNLLASSMTFRLHYWLGAVKVLEQHPLAGIGWGNFGLHYVGVRLPVAAEEVKDPHNLIVRAFVELGIVGGALMLAWLARMWWELTAPTALPATISTEAAMELSPGDKARRAFTVRTIGAISLLAMLSSTCASVDFSTVTPDANWFILLQVMKRSLFLGLLLLGFAAVSLRSSQDAVLDDRPAPWVMYSILAAIAVFLMHSLIDFSLFEPGAMCVFAALLGAGLGMRGGTPTENQPSKSRGWLALGAAAIAWLGIACAIVLPIGIAEARARRADDLIRTLHPRSAATQLRGAFERLWVPNSDYAYRAAIALTRSGASPQEIRTLLDAAIKANPVNVAFFRTRAQVELAQPKADPKRVIDDYEQSIRLDPNDVSLHLEFADALVRLGMKAHALDEYRSALHYNDLLNPDEPKRLQPSKIDQVRRKMESIGQ
jgi:hypothetical protein